MFKSLLPVLLAIAALPAGATTTFYVGSAGETQFDADLITRGLTLGALIDFTGESSGFTITDVGPTLVDFTGSSSITVNGADITLSGGSNTVLQISLPSDVYAIGMFISGITPGDRTWTYGPSGGTMALNVNNTIFFGAMSTTPLAALPTLTLTGPTGAGTYGINVFNFELGTVVSGGGGSGGGSEAPEPSTFALVGSGLMALPWLARRKRRAQSGTPPAAER
jgi:hypothetical protein